MTLAGMRTEVFRRLNENSVSPDFWTEADVDEAINDGLEEISDASEWYERHASIPILKQRPYYDLRTTLGDDTILSPGRALNVQTNRWIDPTHVRDLDYHTYRRWESISTGQLERMFLRGMWWLGFFPQGSADSGWVRFWYKAIPSRLVNATDEPGFPKEFHYGLVEYAVGDLLGQEGETKKSLKFWQAYQEKEVGLTDYANSRQSRDRIQALHG